LRPDQRMPKRLSSQRIRIFFEHLKNI
jgi:hypothetical protein